MFVSEFSEGVALQKHLHPLDRSEIEEVLQLLKSSPVGWMGLVKSADHRVFMMASHKEDGDLGGRKWVKTNSKSWLFWD